jgi:putative ABC transport system ATP-binding protein
MKFFKKKAEHTKTESSLKNRGQVFKEGLYGISKNPPNAAKSDTKIEPKDGPKTPKLEDQPTQAEVGEDRPVRKLTSVTHAQVKQGKVDHPVIEINGLHKSFIVGEQEVRVLTDINFKIGEGDFLIIFGPSGCGKSTLLHTILGLESPSKGRLVFLNNDLYENTTEDDRATSRKQHVGMIYQQANWIKALSVIENVGFPLMLTGMSKEDSLVKAKGVLDQVGMLDWANYAPAELSSGQQQRIALARALINNPKVIIADEPTGNLDYESGQIVMKLLSSLNKEQGKTIIMVTHDLEYLRYSKTALRMLDGQVVGIYDESDHAKLFKELQYKRGFLTQA